MIPVLLASICLASPSQDLVSRRVLTTRGMDMNSFWDMRPSPDGRRVAYSRMGTDGALVVRDLESGDTTQLTDGEWTYSGDDGPVWSPDGGKIAYASTATRTGLRIVDVETRVSETPGVGEGVGWLSPMDWSPDGRSLLCGRSLGDVESLVSVSIDTWAIEVLVAQGLNPREDPTAVYSRDGKYVAYSAIENGNEDVFVVAADGGSAHRVSESPLADRFPLWSPDGRSLVYTNQHGLWSVEVVAGEAAGRPRLLRTVPFDRLVTWTEECGLFYRNDDIVTTFFGVPVDPASGDPRGVPEPLPVGPTPDASRCVWAPDMTRLAYTTTGDGRIRVHSTKDGTLRFIETGFERRPSNLWWARDGGRLYFVPKGEPFSGIFAANPSTGGSQPLFPPMEGAERFHLSPDGESMVFLNGYRGGGQRELIVAKTGERKGQVLATDAEVDGFSNHVRPAFSPDGRQVLFASERSDLWIATTDGSSRRMLARNEDPSTFLHTAVWHPEGDRVICDDWNSLFVVDVGTGARSQVEVPADMGGIDGVWQWSPDGASIVLTATRGRGPELWRVENLLDGH